MIDRAYVQRMARYNRWQNENLYGVADRLPEAERQRERGAFFGSIHKTLSHLLWGDQIWMWRLDGWLKPPGRIPESATLHADWDKLKSDRAALDAELIAWSDRVDDAWLKSDMTYYSLAVGHDVSQPHWVLVTHLFNHQTHHRGQVHCMLTQAGGRPSDTDLPFLPE